MSSAFPWTVETFDLQVRQAIGAYWVARVYQSRRQLSAGAKDAGTSGEVTGGQHLNGLAHLLMSVSLAAGVPAEEIHFSRPLVLPGYYRSQKKWDLVITDQGRLLAAIELKSQSGSFGNNLNNRAEEVLGLAKDFWTAYREKAFGMSSQPWLGYLFLLEDAKGSRAPVGLAPSAFPAASVFKGTSYMDRYRLLCERLVLERDYTATALLASPKGATDGEYSEPDSGLSTYRFAFSLFKYLRGACA